MMLKDFRELPEDLQALVVRDRETLIATKKQHHTTVALYAVSIGPCVTTLLCNRFIDQLMKHTPLDAKQKGKHQSTR